MFWLPASRVDGTRVVESHHDQLNHAKRKYASLARFLIYLPPNGAGVGGAAPHNAAGAGGGNGGGHGGGGGGPGGNGGGPGANGGRRYLNNAVPSPSVAASRSASSMRRPAPACAPD
ncbi:hypothetical protein ABPG75_005081 [Micractinium tetrahymenae]